MSHVPQEILDLLEESLDQPLPDAQAEQVRQAIAADPSLQPALESLRRERLERREWMEACEPDEDHASRLADRIIRATKKQAHGPARNWTFGYAASLAACFVLGLLSIRIFQSRNGTSLPAPANQNAMYDVKLVDDVGHVVGHQVFDSLEKAQKVSDTVNQWEERQQEIRNRPAPPQGEQF